MNSPKSHKRDVREHANLLAHLLYPLQRDRPDVNVEKDVISRFKSLLSLSRLHLTHLYGNSISVFEFTVVREGSVLLISETTNQSLAIAPVKEALQRMDVDVTWLKEKKGSLRNFRSEHVGIFLSALKNIWRHSFLRRREIYGIWKVYIFWSEVYLYVGRLKRNRPASILIANDHTSSMMAIQYAAYLLTIPVDYVQHAHVTSIFPEPRYFRFLFTDGDVSSQVYSNLLPTDSQAKIIAVGPVRFEQTYTTRSKNGRPFEQRRIGLALDFNCLIINQQGIDNLKRSGERDVNLRFHPRTLQSVQKRITQSLKDAGMNVVLFDQQSSADFLLHSKLVFAGNSSILLDAALFGCIPICVSKDCSDYYGFVKSGLVYHVEVIPENFEEFYLDPFFERRQRKLTQYIEPDFLLEINPPASVRMANVIVNGNEDVPSLTNQKGEDSKMQDGDSPKSHERQLQTK